MVKNNQLFYLPSLSFVLAMPSLRLKKDVIPVSMLIIHTYNDKSDCFPKLYKSLIYSETMDLKSIHLTENQCF